MIMLESILTFHGIVSFLTLTIMEIVLGIDNVIFISILTDKIKPEKRKVVRTMGLGLALVVRLFLLALLTRMSQLKEPLFTINGLEFGVDHLIFFAGGVFLLYKSTTEIHATISGEEELKEGRKKKELSVASAVLQIILLDIVFSFDSILTAVVLSGEIVVMSMAVIISMLIMLLASKSISSFINDNPSVKVLALSFLMTIAVTLVAKAFHQEIPHGYIYYSLAFSLVVELLNLRAKKKKEKAESGADEI